MGQKTAAQGIILGLVSVALTCGRAIEILLETLKCLCPHRVERDAGFRPC